MPVELQDVRPPINQPARYFQCIATTVSILVPRGKSILLAGLLLAACSGPLKAQSPAREANEYKADAPSVGANRSRTRLGIPPQAATPPTKSADLPAAETSQFRLDEARLMHILAKEPDDVGALAGMGWIRSQQGNFLAAISFLETARLQRPNDHKLAVALDLDRFRFLMDEARYSVASNDLVAARKSYRAALEIRPNSREASAGLNATLVSARAVGPPTSGKTLRPVAEAQVRFSTTAP